jgi:hypothetical protein
VLGRVTEPSSSSSRRLSWSHVLAGGLVAGAFDILYACLYWFLKAGVPPRRIFQSVAAGLLGRNAARAGGWPTATLGLALHFFIALTMCLVYHLAARRLALLHRRPIICGAVYGVLLYVVMTYVVVPLSAAGGGGGAKDPLWISLSILVHAFLIGVPIALSARVANRETPLDEAAAA